jgi:glucose-6-phosphate isomerase
MAATSGEFGLWERFVGHYFNDPGTGFGIDISRMNFQADFLSSLEDRMQSAYKSMSALEKGGVANPDEGRMVGHYWLRSSNLAPDQAIRTEIDHTLERMKSFAADLHSGKIAPAAGKKFRYLLLVGIGGSALGPQFVNQALGTPTDPISLFCFDNTDPDGMEKVLRSIPDLALTLVVVISKSGGTKETRNGQVTAKRALEAKGLAFSKHFVAVTMTGSELDKTATAEQWLAKFPMWDWVGGRTSELSAVGLLPAALQGFNIDEILRGAREMDALTRVTTTAKNPAALMALMWFHAGKGKGQKDMVVLPYKDRLELFSRYLQQLLMESLGKELDLAGAKVNQGIAVYGNKGSTDQHAYVQQLRDGLNNFFIVFIEVLKDQTTKSRGGGLPADFNCSTLEVEPGVNSGDYLAGFYQGTRKALFESGRESITITIKEVNEHAVGMLIALFERAVGLYASLININAYHQPGVEAGKKAAAEVLSIQAKVEEYLKKNKGAFTAQQIATALVQQQNCETIYRTLRRLAENGRVKVTPSERFGTESFAI